MATVTLKGTPFETIGDLPPVGAEAPDFVLTGSDLSDIKLGDYAGKRIILNIFPSVDTPTCAQSVRTFNEKVSQLDNTVVINVSADLPFAQARFCGSEGLDRVINGSTFRSDFGENYGVTFRNGPLNGLLSRAVVVINPDGRVAYTQQVAETADEPDYDAVLASL